MDEESQIERRGWRGRSIKRKRVRNECLCITRASGCTARVWLCLSVYEQRGKGKKKCLGSTEQAEERDEEKWQGTPCWYMVG